MGLSMLAKQTESLALVSPDDQKVRLSFSSYVTTCACYMVTYCRDQLWLLAKWKDKWVNDEKWWTCLVLSLAASALPCCVRGRLRCCPNKANQCWHTAYCSVHSVLKYPAPVSQVRKGGKEPMNMLRSVHLIIILPLCSWPITMHGLSVRQTLPLGKFTDTKLTCLLLRATERTLISAERKTMWKRKDGDAQNLQYGDSDII